MASQKNKDRINAVIERMPPEVFGYESPNLINRILLSIGLPSFNEQLNLEDLPEVFYDDVIDYSDNEQNLSDEALENIVHLVMAREGYHSTNMNEYPDENGERKVRFIKGAKYDHFTPEMVRWALTNMPMPDLGLEFSYNRLENQPRKDDGSIGRSITGEPIVSYLDSKTVSEIVDKGLYRFQNGPGGAVRLFYSMPDGLEMEVPAFNINVGQGPDGFDQIRAAETKRTFGIMFPDSTRHLPDSLFDDGLEQDYVRRKYAEAQKRGYELDEKQLTEFEQILSERWQANQRIRRIQQGDITPSTWEMISGFFPTGEQLGAARPFGAPSVRPLFDSQDAASAARSDPSVLQGGVGREFMARLNRDDHVRDILWYERNSQKLGRVTRATGFRFRAELEGAQGSTFEQSPPQEDITP